MNRPPRFLRWALFALVLATVACPRLSAQQIPLEVEVSFDASVVLNSSFNPNNYYPQGDPYRFQNYFYATLAGGSSVPQPFVMEVPQIYWKPFTLGKAKMRPGKKYTLVFRAEHIQEYRLNFAPVAGYKVFVDGVHSYRKASTHNGYLYETFTVHLEPASGAVPFGAADSIDGGSRIFWQVGMGNGLNGASAGHIQIRQANFSTNLFTPAVLEYESCAEGVEIVRSGPNLRQVKTPRGLVDIHTLSSSSYEIRFYYDSEVGAKSGSLWTTTGLPFVNKLSFLKPLGQRVFLVRFFWFGKRLSEKNENSQNPRGI